MSTRSSLVHFIELFGSAISAAGAVDNGAQPKARDLRRLGIDPERFREIKRY